MKIRNILAAMILVTVPAVASSQNLTGLWRGERYNFIIVHNVEQRSFEVNTAINTEETGKVSLTFSGIERQPGRSVRFSGSANRIVPFFVNDEECEARVRIYMEGNVRGDYGSRVMNLPECKIIFHVKCENFEPNPSSIDCSGKYQ